MEVHQVRALLAREIKKAGTAKAFAESKGMSSSYLSDILSGNREPALKLLDALGLERVVTYRRKAHG